MERDRPPARPVPPDPATVLDRLGVGILVVSSAGRVSLLNPAGARLLRTQPVAADGPSLVEVIRQPSFLEFVRDARSRDGGLERRLALVVPGEEREIELRGIPLPGDEGNLLIEMTDVTRLHRLEIVRREFVANVSHELKTPITAIRGFVEVLLEQSDMPAVERRRYLEIVHRQSERLHVIIEDLLALSRLERDPGMLRDMIAVQPIRPLLEAALRHCLPLAEQDPAAPRLSCDPDLRWPVVGDLLEQAVVNLVDNALKHSGTTEPVLVEAVVDGDVLRVSVRDHGRGIESRHLPRLFERFYRVDRDRSRRRGGTGLGLSIVKHIARVHAGDVGVVSRPGEGSVFTLSLPRLAVDETAPTGGGQATPHGDGAGRGGE